MFRYIVAIIITIISFGCYSKNLNRKKTPVVMEGNIFPEFIECKLPVHSLFNGEKTNEMILVSPIGSIHTTILEKDKLKASKSKLNFELPCKRYYISRTKKILFGYGGRDFHAADLEMNVVKRINVTYETNERILDANMINVDKKEILVCVSHDGWNRNDSYSYYLGYDLRENKILYKNTSYKSGMSYYVDDTTMLFQKWNYPNPVNWFFTDNKFEAQEINMLTDKLNEINLKTRENTIDFINNKMIGYFENDSGLYTYCLIRWKDPFQDPQITPFTFQKPKKRYMTYKYEFSPDGKWVKSTSNAKHPDKNTWIMFYHCDDAYPGGLSIPIHGGDSNQDSRGVFLDTEEHGMVYLDISKGLDGIIYMYKMNDVLEQIGKRAKEMVE